MAEEGDELTTGLQCQGGENSGRDEAFLGHLAPLFLFKKVLSTMTNPQNIHIIATYLKEYSVSTSTLAVDELP